jgi:integrase
MRTGSKVGTFDPSGSISCRSKTRCCTRPSTPPTDLSPHDLRRTAITRALVSGLTYRQVQMMSKHRDPKTVMRYDHGRENLEQNAVNFLVYDEE